jgi:methyl-accepting chemotaxis protein
MKLSGFFLPEEEDIHAMETLISLMNRMGLGAKFALNALLLTVPAALLGAAEVWPQHKHNLLILTGVSGGMALAFTLAFFLSVRRALDKLNHAVKSMAAGDLSARSQIESSDGFGALALNFNEMARETGRLIKEVHGATDEVASAARELTSAASRVVSGATAQCELAVDSTQAVEEMRSSVEQVAEAARLSREIAEKSEAMAENGTAVVDEAGSEMERIRASMVKLETLVLSMGENSDEIGNIVNVIRDIADQTNLLALNAAIEAARAGEQGRGFAVVADEVRKLAERTTNATVQISGMIDGILQQIDGTVHGMQEGRAQAEQGVILARRAGEALESIREGGHQTMDRVRAIAEATATQTAASRQAVASMEEIAKRAAENNAASDEAAAVAGHLESLASNLRASVQRFRI